MTRKDALRRALDHIHTRQVLLIEQEESHERGLAECRRFLRALAEEKSAIDEMYNDLVRSEFAR